MKQNCFHTLVDNRNVQQLRQCCRNCAPGHRWPLISPPSWMPPAKTADSGRRRIRPFSSGQRTIATGKATETLSRTERRLLMRKERNQAKRKTQEQAKTDHHRRSGRHGRQRPPQADRSSSFAGAWFTRLLQQHMNNIASTDFYRSKLMAGIQQLAPRIIPGPSPERVRWEHWVALLYRLPLWVLLGWCLTDENVVPYTVQASLGPSMLPTIQFCGDVWLVETGAWTRAWSELKRRLVGSMGPTTKDDESGGDDQGQTGNDNRLLPSNYTVGDLVLWKDPHTGRVSCKRLIGMEGDTVQRYGQYATMYSRRPDLGIIWPSDAVERGMDADPKAPKSWDVSSVSSSPSSVEDSHLTRQLVVPKGCVWLEGDCPLFSVDSRQYGPILVDCICGLLLFRLWPWKRQELLRDEKNAYLSSCRISRQRPVPYPTVESYLGRRFGFYRVPKTPPVDPTEN